MVDRLEKLFELRVLWARAHGQRESLLPSEAARLHVLLSAFPPGVPNLDPRDTATTLAQPLPAHLSVSGHFRTAMVHNLAADGLALMTETLPALDQWVTLTIGDPETEFEYLFPCRVAARVLTGHTWLGLRFAGTPAQRRARGLSSGVWGRDAPPRTSAPPRASAPPRTSAPPRASGVPRATAPPVQAAGGSDFEPTHRFRRLSDD